MGLLSATMKTELQKRNPEVYPIAELTIDGTTYRYASAGVQSDSQGQYMGKVLRWGSLSRGFSPFVPSLNSIALNFDIDDIDFAFSKIVEGSSGDHIRNAPAKTYLASPNVAQADWFTVLDGRIDSVAESTPLVWTITLRTNDRPLQMWLPRERITVADFPNAPGNILGSFVPFIYGTHNSDGITDEGFIPCYYIDSANYSYLVSYGLIKEIVSVYADTGSGLTKLDPAVWDRLNVTKNGKDFTLIDFSSDTYDDVAITADVKGYEDAGDGSGALIADPSDQLKHFLVNFVYNEYKRGSWFADNTAPVNTTHFATMKAFFTALGTEGSWYLFGNQRQGIDILNEWLEVWQVYAFWTNAGEIAVLPLDYRATTLYIDDPWLRGSRDDLGAWAYPEQPDVIDRVTIQYLHGRQSQKYHQTLEVRDPAMTEQATESLRMIWSVARLV